MAAYAALVSVMQIIDQLEHHPRPPISLDKVQTQSLTKNVMFLQEFLEGYNPTRKYEEDGVESRIRDAAHAVEDVIESHIVDRIEAGSTSHADEVEFGQRLQKVIDDMDLINKEVVETKEKMAVQQKGLTSSSSRQKQTVERNSTSSSTAQKQNTTMVGFDDALLELLDKLTGGGLERQIIPIVGMGGMGKTTLARNVYEHALIREHFDIHAWATFSQEYDAGNILNDILSQSKQAKGNSSEADVKQVGEDLHKYLFGRRYLIVMDDMWNIEAYDKIKFFFPDNKNGSRIVVTTRLSNLARCLSGSHSLDMRFLDMDESWDLFSGIVFPGDDYPSKMMEIGKNIVKNCRGLPLSIVVVGGFLAKSEYKIEYWKYIEENLSSFVNSDNDEHCLNILQLSYNQLPVHLKSCFLYMGVFEEDKEIHNWELAWLWIAEGLLKPISGKDLEEVTKEYLNDLFDRNLIFRGKRYRNPEDSVMIHDLLRDFCSRQAKVEKFYNVVTRHTDHIPENQRRILVPGDIFEDEEAFDVVRSMSLIRTLHCYGSEICLPTYHRLLRIYRARNPLMIDEDCYFLEDKLRLFNLRYLDAESITCHSKLNSSFHLLWNLQTVFLGCGDNDDGFNEPLDIWNMPQLRHVFVRRYTYLLDPPVRNGQDDIVLEYLQTLARVRNFKCSKEVVKRIPNIKMLCLDYDDDEEESCLNNLDRLHKLQNLWCWSKLRRDRYGTDFMQKLTFPRSLMEIVLDSNNVHWEDMLEKIGSLPLLHSLNLSGGFFTTGVWETVEGQFPNLKSLEFSRCAGLEYWNSESSHFPRLQRLALYDLHALNEIPSGIGEIPTLQTIDLSHCSKSAVISCKRMLEEQEELYGEEEVTFQVSVYLGSEEYEALQHLASPNFKIPR